MFKKLHADKYDIGFALVYTVFLVIRLSTKMMTLIAIPAAVFEFLTMILLITLGKRHITNCAVSISILHSERFSTRFWKIFALMTIFWLPTLLLTFNSGFEFDTETAVLQGLGLIDFPCNPIWSNVVFTGIYRIGVSIGNYPLAAFVYRALQLFSMIAIISYAFARITEKKQQPIFVVFCLGLICVVPQFSTYAGGMGKDSILSLFMLVFVVMTYCLFRDEQCGAWKYVLLIAVSALLPLTRNGAMAVVLPALVLIVIFSKVNIKRIVAIIACVATLLTGVVLPKVMGVQRAYTEESLSIPIQQVGACAAKGKLTEEEMQVVDELFLGFSMEEQYQPASADTIKGYFHYDFLTAEQQAKFWKLWRDCLAHHPMVCFNAFVNMNYMYFALDEISECKDHSTCLRSSSLLLEPQTSAEQFTFYQDRKFLRAEVIEEIEAAEEAERELKGEEKVVGPIWPKISKGARAIIDKLWQYDASYCRLPILGVFCKIGIYTWMMFYALGKLLSKKDKRAIAFVPLLVILIGCCFGPINGYFRYALPMIWGTIVLGVMVYSDTERK